MLNHIVIMGRLTREPELRTTQSGVNVASFSVAVDRDFGGRDGGERQTDFFDVSAWRQTGEFVSKYFHKGARQEATPRAATAASPEITAVITPLLRALPRRRSLPAPMKSWRTTASCRSDLNSSDFLRRRFHYRAF